MILPAASARFWAQGIGAMIGVAVLVAIIASITGLYLSYYFSLPSGPAIILVAGGLYMLSVILGKQDSLIVRYIPRQHLES
jgi:zinc/manganese transport system permease protein